MSTFKEDIGRRENRKYFESEVGASGDRCRRNEVRTEREYLERQVKLRSIWRAMWKLNEVEIPWNPRD